MAVGLKAFWKELPGTAGVAAVIVGPMLAGAALGGMIRPRADGSPSLSGALVGGLAGAVVSTIALSCIVADKRARGLV